MKLPPQMRQVVTALIEADANSRFFYALSEKTQTHLYLIEFNLDEAYTDCHHFTTDKYDQGYAYESMCLSHIRTFCCMANML